MDRSVKMRLTWVKLFLETGNASLVCRRCGISPPTLRKWVRRYSEFGEAGLVDESRRPHSSPNTKIDTEIRELILRLRRERRIGARRLQNELLRHHQIRLSLATIHKVLTGEGVQPLKRPKRLVATVRYQRPIPGDRVQMDTCKIAAGVYQYTAVDDCTRLRVLGVFTRRTAANTIEFLEQVLEEMYFPLQRIQTDRGGEFFARSVQQWMMDNGIKFRPVKPRSPHLNGKVERSQRTDKEEFWAALSSIPEDLEVIREELAVWQHYYNWHRPHGSLNGKTPIERYCDLIPDTPYWSDVYEAYESGIERFKERDYHLDQKLQKVKGSL